MRQPQFNHHRAPSEQLTSLGIVRGGCFASSQPSPDLEYGIEPVSPQLETPLVLYTYNRPTAASPAAVHSEITAKDLADTISIAFVALDRRSARL